MLAVNACAAIRDPAVIASANVVKVAMRPDRLALLFSRQPIPYPRGAQPDYLRQLGLYGLTRAGLDTFAGLPPGPLELAESIEMLRLLEHGFAVRMVQVDDAGTAVDTPEDLARVERMLRATQAGSGAA
ncbi:MAG: hypothetical protein L0Y54_17590 [Sporichthyaceae bacterium]|nr:hypothetical protein [Sporichthyaceae bacterium]